MLFADRFKASIFGAQYLAIVDSAQQMKAIELRYNKTKDLPIRRDILLCEKPVPVAQGDEILIKVKAAAINSLDVEFYKKPSLKNYLGYTKQPPYIMDLAQFFLQPSSPYYDNSRDFSGEVVALGPNASKFKVGDEVFGFVSLASKSTGGSFAQYCKVTEQAVCIKPANLSHIQAAALPWAGFAAWQGLYAQQLVNVTGERALVLGASGGLGSICAQILQNVLHASVVATMHKNNRPKAMNEGYYMILDTNDEEDMSLLIERSFDVLVDATTDGVNEKEWNKYVAYGGRYVRFQGVDPKAVGEENENNFFTNFGSALHSVVSRWTSILVNGVHTKRYFFFDRHPKMIGEQLDVIRYMAEQKRIKPIIDSVYNIEDYVAALERFQQRNGVKYGKVILKISEDADQIKPGGAEP